MNEACLNLLGQDIASAEGQLFALRVLDFMRERPLPASRRRPATTYNLEATPAEGTSYRLAQLDASASRTSLSANDRDVRDRRAAPFYTNSTPAARAVHRRHLRGARPAGRAADPATPAARCCTSSSARRSPDPRRRARTGAQDRDRYHLPYFTITPTFSICPTHGYLRRRAAALPALRRRVRGLLAGGRLPAAGEPVEQGKQAEFENRKSFNVAS